MVSVAYFMKETVSVLVISTSTKGQEGHTTKTLSLMLALLLKHQFLLTLPLLFPRVICGAKSLILDMRPAPSQTTPILARHSFS